MTDTTSPPPPDEPNRSQAPRRGPVATDLWCPVCARTVADPLVCGDCSAVLCRVCGSPLESADDLSFG